MTTNRLVSPQHIPDAERFLDLHFPLEGVPDWTSAPTDQEPRRWRSGAPGPRNERGFRGDSLRERGDVNIAYLGCSWVEGLGVEWHELFSNIVATRLRRSTGHDIRSWNFGRAGTGLDFAVRILPQILRIQKPDLVILVVSAPGRREYFTSKMQRLDFRPKTIERYRTGAIDIEADLLAAMEGLTSLDNDYDNMAHILRIFGLLPMAFEVTGTPWAYTWLDGPNAHRVMNALKDAKRLPHDQWLGFPFPRIDETKENDGHPGPESHRAFADLLIEWITQNGIVQRAVDGRPVEMPSAARDVPRGVARSVVDRLLGGKTSGGRGKDRSGEDEGDMYPLW